MVCKRKKKKEKQVADTDLLLKAEKTTRQLQVTMATGNFINSEIQVSFSLSLGVRLIDFDNSMHSQ